MDWAEKEMRCQSLAPTEAQILAAKVRAAAEAFYLRTRRRHYGGFIVPSNDECYEAVSKETGVCKTAISFCLTFSRSCTHPWSDGACSKCPPADHIPF